MFPAEAAGGPLAFTFGTWFTWTAVGIAFPLLGVLLVAAAGPLAAGAYESLPALGATHLATLGWVSMTIIGAASQTAPALLGARIRGEGMIPWMYALFSIGTAGVVGGFLRGDFALVTAGGAGVNLASWWSVGLLAATVARAGPKRGIVTPHIPAALFCFILVLLWGATLAANLHWAFWPGLLIAHRGLVVHLTLGLGGWFGLMVVGVFYRLVPLVHGARVASVRRGRTILAVAVPAIAATLWGIAAGGAWLFRAAALLGAAGLALFCVEVVHVLAHRRNRAPDLNVGHWYAVAGYSAVLAAIGAGWALGWLRIDPPGRLAECVVVLFVLGWVTQAIIGQLYKITPFLMWYYRATIPDVLAIPRQPAPYNPPLGRMVLWLSNLGAAGFTIGIWGGSSPVAQGGAALFAAGAFVLAYMLAYRWLPAAITGRLVFEWRWRIS